MSHDDVYEMDIYELREALVDPLNTNSPFRDIAQIIDVLIGAEYAYWEIRGGAEHDKCQAIVQKEYTDGISSATGPTERVALMRATLIAERKSKDDR